jgi:DNA repair exonuclease SbcCD ATPase subunit
MSELTQQEQAFFETQGETAPETPEVETPVVEATEASETQPEATEAAEPAKPKLVPLEALAKELKSQLARLNQERQEFAQWRAQIESRLNPQQQTQVPAFEENPAENLRHEVTTAKEELAAIKRQSEDSARQAQFANWYQTQAAAFSQSQPDFMDTYSAFIEARQTELADAGMTPQQIVAKVQQEEQLLALTAAQMGVNPAQMVYQTAIAKGIKPKAKPSAENATQKLQNVADGIKSSKSLSQVPGRPVPAMTAEYVANMSDADFKKFAANWDDNISQLSA